MENLISTKINFLSKNSGFIPEGSATNIPPTGDILFLISIILFALSFIALIMYFCKRKNIKPFNLLFNIDKKNDFSIQGIYVKNKAYIISICVCFFIAITLFFVSLTINNAFAKNEISNEPIPVKCSDSINAYVDENTGDISFDEAYIKNESKDEDFSLNKVALQSKEDVGNCTWTIKTSDYKFYDGIIDFQKDCDYTINADSIIKLEYSLQGMNLDTAKSLIGKTVAVTNFYIKTLKPTFGISGKISVEQSQVEKTNRNIELEQQKVYFVSNHDKTFNADVNKDGSYEIKDIDPGSTGKLFSSIIGCKTYICDSSDFSMEHSINIDEPIEKSVNNMNFKYVGPHFDYYTLEELKTAANDISNNKDSSIYQNEFNQYIINDEIWWSNSNGMQPNTCTAQDSSSADVQFCNQKYKCSFETEDSQVQTDSDINQFLFLRVIGINQDKISGQENNAGLTFQAIHCLPCSIAYCDDDSWQPQKQFGKFWGDINCSLRNNMNLEEGSIFKNLSSVFKDNIVSVNKDTQRTHKWPKQESDIVKTQDKLFSLSYTEMCSSNTEYYQFKGYPWLFDGLEGNQYLWYKYNNISGNNSNSKLEALGKCNNNQQLQFGYNPWLRTSYYRSDNEFMFLDSQNGSFNQSNHYTNNFGIVLAFCL